MSKKTLSPKNSYEWFVARYEKLGYRSLNQFAAKNGYQKSSLSRYFHQQRQVPADTLVSLCKTLKVSPGVLLVALGHDL